MILHKEGFGIIATFFIVLLVLNLIVGYFTGIFISVPLGILSLAFWVFTLWFFRNPKRVVKMDDNAIVAPADGKVVVIEETSETEFLNDRRIQVSIFMSPLNVHVNRYPLSGKVVYQKYHKGLYLVAWHPKSSTDNERTTVVVENAKGVQVLFRQIAGAVARRIVCYAKAGDNAVQGEDFGFIKFGSRVDIFLPLTAKINVNLDQKVSGNKTVIAYLE
ncbi:MAG: phosphatidylserine decarboxylase family protein [Bacteroidota bacterium]|nr:phosphatidylserine decarboxylase family protein [Bacteroidota bacterium]